MDRGDVAALMLDTSSHFIRYLLITEEDVGRAMEGLNRSSLLGHDIHPFIMKPLAGIIPGHVCMVFQKGID